MDSPVSQIKERLSIEDVVSSYIKLETIGTNLKARCPFHSEKTPSFFVSPNRNSYYCFGCGAKGDIFTFVEEFEGVDFKGALKILAEKAGVSLSNFKNEEIDNKEILYKIMEDTTIYFSNNLLKNKNALNYLKGRGLEGKSISLFRIGFAVDSWRELFLFLKQKGYKEDDIERAGLIKKIEKNYKENEERGYYDRFRSRIIFPLFDSSSRVIAFSGRIFESSEEKKGLNPAKYLNSPETLIFNKSSILYGLNFAKDSIRKNNFVILVEGQMDLVLSHQAGFRNTIATSGTALSENIYNEHIISNLGLVRRLTSNIVLVFDNDNAGFNATLKAGKIALSFGMDTKVAKIPKEMDPADVISKLGKDSWKKIIKDSQHIILFLMDKILEENKDQRKIGKEIKDKILPYIFYLESNIDKNFFLKSISDMSQIPFNILEEDFRFVSEKIKKGQKEVFFEQDLILSDLIKKDFILKRALGILYWQESLSKNSLDTSIFFEKIAQIFSTTQDILKQKFKTEKEEMIYQAEELYKDSFSLEEELNILIVNIQEEILREDLNKKLKELHLAEREEKSEKVKQILEDYQKIINKIESLKNK